MAQFNADIALKVNSTAAERQIKKVDRNLQKIESTTKDILGVDKQIIRERRALIRLSGEQATKSKRRIKDLSLQKAELSLQKRELQQINRLEKQRAANISRASGASASGGGGIGGVEAVGAGFLAARALSPQSLVRSSKILQSKKEFRDRQKDILDTVNEDLDAATEVYKQKLARYNEVRSKFGLLSKKGTTQPNTRSSRNAFNTARANYFDVGGQVRSQSKFVGNLDKEVERLTKNLDASAKASRKAQSAFGGLRKVLVQLGLAFGAIEIARFIGNSFKTAAAIESQRIRLKALSTGFDDYQLVLQAVDRAQGLFNQTQQEAAEGFGTAYSRLRPLGLTLEQIQAVYEGFNTAALNSGTTAAEAAGAFTQLTQALGAGALRGDELRSILEQTPAIAQAIANELKITVGQLKDFGKDGKISSEAVLKALVAVRNEGVNKLSEALDTPVQKFKKLEIAGENFKIAIADEALPAVTEAVEELAKIIVALEGPIRFISRLVNKTLGGITDLINAATKPGEYGAAASIRGGRIPFNVEATRSLFEGTGPQGKGLQGLKDQAAELAKLRNQPQRDVLLQLMQDRLEAIEKVKKAAIEPITISTDLSGVLGDNPTGDEDPKTKTIKELLGTDWDKALGIKESEAQLKLTEMQNEALLAGDRLLFDRIEKQREYVRDLLEIDALNDAIEKAQARLVEYEGDKELLGKANNQIQDLKNEKLQRELNLRNALATAGTNALQDDIDAAIAFGKIVQGVEPLNKELTETEVLLNGIGTTFQTGLVDAISLAVSGTDKLGESFQNLAADIAETIGKALILSAIQQGLSALGGGDGVGLFSILRKAFGGGRANGGPVTGGTPYEVGERGPELFIPGQSGTVVSADVFAETKAAMGVSSASSDAFAENEASISTTNTFMRGASEVQAQEAALASMSNAPIRVEVDTVNVGGLDVITQEQFAVGMQATAKQARAQVFADMKNRPATRRQLGMN